MEAYGEGYRGLEGRFYEEFMVQGGYRYGLFPDGDHTMGAENAFARTHIGVPLLNSPKLSGFDPHHGTS